MEEMTKDQLPKRKKVFLSKVKEVIVNLIYPLYRIKPAEEDVSNIHFTIASFLYNPMIDTGNFSIL